MKFTSTNKYCLLIFLPAHKSLLSTAKQQVFLCRLNVPLRYFYCNISRTYHQQLLLHTLASTGPATGSFSCILRYKEKDQRTSFQNGFCTDLFAYFYIILISYSSFTAAEIFFLFLIYAHPHLNVAHSVSPQ